MSQRNIFTVFVLVVALIGACCTAILFQPDMMPLEASRPLIERVIERHDAYALEAEPDVAQWFYESGVITEALKDTEFLGRQWFEDHFEPVAVRHDSWVSEDPSLLDYQRSTALRDTAILRRYYEPEAE